MNSGRECRICMLDSQEEDEGRQQGQSRFWQSEPRGALNKLQNDNVMID